MERLRNQQVFLSEEDVANQVIWHNQMIKLGGKTSFGSKMFQAGFWFICDLFVI